MIIEKNISPLEIKKADYLDGFRVAIYFNDGVKKTIDFTDFLNSQNSYYSKKYKNTSNFRKFKIENGNIVWGDEWDLIFPIKDLRKGRISIS